MAEICSISSHARDAAFAASVERHTSPKKKLLSPWLRRSSAAKFTSDSTHPCPRAWLRSRSRKQTTGAQLKYSPPSRRAARSSFASERRPSERIAQARSPQQTWRRRKATSTTTTAAAGTRCIRVGRPCRGTLTSPYLHPEKTRRRRPPHHREGRATTILTSSCHLRA